MEEKKESNQIMFSYFHFSNSPFPHLPIIPVSNYFTLLPCHPVTPEASSGQALQPFNLKYLTIITFLFTSNGCYFIENDQLIVPFSVFKQQTCPKYNSINR